jgi:hypothetical protein
MTKSATTTKRSGVATRPAAAEAVVEGPHIAVAGDGGMVRGVVEDEVCLVTPGANGAAGAAGAANKFADSGGATLQVMQLFLIYWGTQWTATPAPVPTSGQVSSAAATMMASPYMTGLNEYRGIGRGFVRGSATITSSNPANGFTDNQVATFIDGLITAGTIPGPDVDNQTLYCVIMPKGVNASNASFIGEHTYYTRSGQRIRFAWVTNNGTLNSITNILSHEVVEAATDPEGTAWLGVAGTCSGTGWCEIGDICQSTSAVLDGVTVQSFWSDQAGACVVPAWPNRTYPRVGVQFTGVVAAHSSHRWFTFNWPEWERVEWRMLPTTIKPGAAELTWSVAIERATGNNLTYWITVTNLTDQPVAFEGRYCVLGRN